MILKSLWWLKNILKWSCYLELSMNWNIIESIGRHYKEIWVEGETQGKQAMCCQRPGSWERTLSWLLRVQLIKFMRLVIWNSFLYGPDLSQFKGKNRRASKFSQGLVWYKINPEAWPIVLLNQMKECVVFKRGDFCIQGEKWQDNALPVLTQNFPGKELLNIVHTHILNTRESSRGISTT